MNRGSSLLEFLQSMAEKRPANRSEIRTHLPDLISSFGFDDYSLDSDVEGSIADAVVLPHLDNAPVLAIQFGYDPEVENRGPHLPHRPSHVHYPTEDQIIEQTSADYVISLSNATLAVRGKSYARTVVFQESDQSLDKIPTYAYLAKEVTKEIVNELHPEKMRESRSEDQTSLNDF